MELNKDSSMPQAGNEGNPKSRKGKPSFDEFIASLREAAMESGTPRKTLVTIVRLLKTGFAIEKDKELMTSHIDAVEDALGHFDSIDDLVLKLFAEFPSQPKPGKKLPVFVRNRFSSRLCRDLGYPSERRPGEDRLADLTQWIRHGTVGRQAEEDPYPEQWVRKAFICLANEPDAAIRCLAINALLRTVSVNRSPELVKEPDPAYDYVKAVSGGLFAGRLNELLGSRVLLHPEVLTQEELRRARRASDSALGEVQSRYEQAETLVTQLMQQLESALARITELEEGVAAKSQALEQAMVAAVQREEHLTHEWQQRLSGQRHTLSKHMLHDIEEAIMCLDRKEPNVDMALSRVRNAEKAIREME